MGYPVEGPGKLGNGQGVLRAEAGEGRAERRRRRRLTVDSKGNVYITSALGLQVFDPARQDARHDQVPGAAGERDVRRQGHEDAVRDGPHVGLHVPDGGRRAPVPGEIVEGRPARKVLLSS